MDQSWFESCAARAEPCQLAVWKVKMCCLKSSDVFFVRSSVLRERRCCSVGDNLDVFLTKIGISLSHRYTHTNPHMVLTRRGEQTSSPV